ncbi:MAG: hypothetical protein JWQ95_5458 [Sphaerisporangium sp.]|jgi:hypothetical protein|nr:hypothetical protein [Sphaerisporangium sp.]
MASLVDLSGVVWRKSSHSSVGNCVELAHLPGGRVGLRDSKNHSGPVLVLAQGQWDAFIAGLKDGKMTG